MLGELKPKGKLLTPFNVISIPIILLGAVLLVIRFTQGLGSVTNLTQDYPWGLWIGFDVVTGVAFAGGAYVITFMVYVLRLEKYHPIVRVTVLNGFLAYVFYAGALLLDLGRPWNVINPIIGNSFGVSSVLFLVAWHFMLYMIAEFIEFSPAIAEWLGWKRVRKILGRPDPRCGDLRHHALDAAPVGPRRAVPDGQGQDPPALVLRVHPDPVLRLEHLRRPVDGDLRGHDQPPGLPPSARRKTMHASHDDPARAWRGSAPARCSSTCSCKALVFVHGRALGVPGRPAGAPGTCSRWSASSLVPCVLFTRGVAHGAACSWCARPPC